MIKKFKIKKNILKFCFLFFVFFLLIGSGSVAEATQTVLQKAQSGLGQAAVCGFGSDSDCTADANGVGVTKVAETGIMTSVPGAIGQVIGVALSFVGALFMILMIYGGILWMTARGNETQVTKAKDLLTTAVIGLVIVLAAYAITSFIGAQLVVSTN